MSPQEHEPPAQDRADVDSRPWGWLVLAAALAPSVAAIWFTPAFTTQDGPAHLYNAHVLAESLRADSPFRDVFLVRWSPLPNWSGHLLLMGLGAVASPGIADRLATSIPLVGLAASVFWMRRRVAGRSGEVPAALLSAVLGLNVAWLFGFTSFLLGACLFPITLGLWWIWAGRGASIGRSLAMAALIVVGYFAHLVSLGLTVVGLGILTLATPGRDRARLVGTAATLSPLAVLVPIYRGLMGRGGPIEPIWGHVGSWRGQLGWVDPLSLGKKGVFPFVPGETAWFGLISPAALVLATVVILVATTWNRRDRDRRGWAILAAVLLIGGVFTPDTLGESHGNYLPQRVILLGLAALVPWLHFDLLRWPGRLAAGLLAAAVAVQSLSVWDYARESSGRVGPFVRGLEAIGRGHRVGTLLIGIRGRFRSNPVMHADNLLGVGTGNVIWSDYETAHYYFPVQFRPEVPRPPADRLETIAKMDDPGDAPKRAAMWRDLLAAHHAEMDVLLVWGQDPALDAINATWFEPEPFHQDGPLRLFRHR